MIIYYLNAAATVQSLSCVRLFATPWNNMQIKISQGKKCMGWSPEDVPNTELPLFSPLGVKMCYCITLVCGSMHRVLPTRESFLSFDVQRFSWGLIISALIDCPNIIVNLNLQVDDYYMTQSCYLEKEMATHSSVLAWKNPMDRGAWQAAVRGVAKSRTPLSDFTFTFHFHALEKEMATHSSDLAWRLPGTGEPGGLPSIGLHRVRQD